MRHLKSRALLLTAFIFLLTLSASSQSGRLPKATPTPNNEDIERVDTEEIKLNVVAFDNNGDFVSNMKGSDLVITENDILHQPSSVRRIPAHVLIVMDTGGEMRQVKSLDRTRQV